MSDIDAYLSELRSHLTDLDPKRADEIVAEARTHLQSRAAQLRAGGMEGDEAGAESIKCFGDPQRVARDLRKGNTRYRWHDDHVALALLLAFAGFCAANLLLPGSPSWFWYLDRWFANHTFLVPSQVRVFITVLLASPAALLAGLLAGRRGWWVAGLPPVCLGAVLGILHVGKIIFWQSTTASDSDDIIVGVTLVLLAGPLLAAYGFLGSRFRKQFSSARSPV